MLRTTMDTLMLLWSIEGNYYNQSGVNSHIENITLKWHGILK